MNIDSKKQKWPNYLKPTKTSQSFLLANNFEVSLAVSSTQKKQKQHINKDRNFNIIICYNCNKKKHYASKYPEFLKNKSKK